MTAPMTDARADVWLVPRPALSFDQLTERYGHWLSADEQRRLQTQRTPKGAYTFLLTRVALRALLSRRQPHVLPGQWQFERSSAGRPYVINVAGAPDFNLSHAGDALVIVLASHGRVGVDIESSGRQVNDLSRLAQRYFQRDETRSLLALPAARQLPRFLTLWTLKEACVKATGQGLANALQEFYFDLDSPPVLRCERFDRDMTGYTGGDEKSDDQKGAEQQGWYAWSGLLHAPPRTQADAANRDAPEQQAISSRLSIVWQLRTAVGNEAQLNFQHLLFPEHPESELAGVPADHQWQADWHYSMYSRTNLEP